MTDKADPAGMAALLLVESLMLALVEAGLIGQDEIAGTIEDVLATHRALPERDRATAEAAARLVTRTADRLLGAVPRRRKSRDRP
ncbi:MAG TPA: hypothetical protein VHY76_14245 [Acetobacteraceae bacterium]|jgi:hypothetical protein|nr:hypothetical protein [Acetobacteraceae bacterium]